MEKIIQTLHATVISDIGYFQPSSHDMKIIKVLKRTKNPPSSKHKLNLYYSFQLSILQSIFQYNKVTTK